MHFVHTYLNVQYKYTRVATCSCKAFSSRVPVLLRFGFAFLVPMSLNKFVSLFQNLHSRLPGQNNFHSTVKKFGVFPIRKAYVKRY